MSDLRRCKIDKENKTEVARTCSGVYVLEKKIPVHLERVKKKG